MQTGDGVGVEGYNRAVEHAMRCIEVVRTQCDFYYDVP